MAIFGDLTRSSCSRDAHINRRDATANSNTMRVARVCYRGPHASCLIAACSLLILMADAAADSETPWRGLPSVALGQSVTGRRGPGAKAMRVTITRPYAIFSDLTRSHAISRAVTRSCPLKVYNTPSSGVTRHPTGTAHTHIRHKRRARPVSLRGSRRAAGRAAV